MTRLRRLTATALVDSFGLSLGWTVFSLHVTASRGLAGLGLCNAAMLVGVALSAPVAARLSARLDGRALLRLPCVTEAVLRVGTFALLLAGAAAGGGGGGGRGQQRGRLDRVRRHAGRGRRRRPARAAMTWYMVAVAG